MQQNFGHRKLYMPNWIAGRSGLCQATRNALEGLKLHGYDARDLFPLFTLSLTTLSSSLDVR